MALNRRLINHNAGSAANAFSRVIKTNGIGTTGFHPLDDAVHPLVGRSACGMSAVTATGKLVVGAIIETALVNLLLQQVVDAGILNPVGRANPQEGNIANLGEHLLQIGTTGGLDIGDIQLIRSQAHHDIIGVILVDELGQARCLAPTQGGTAVPDDLNQRVAILVTIGSQAFSKALQHRVADEEDILGRRVHGSPPPLGMTAVRHAAVSLQAIGHDAVFLVRIVTHHAAKRGSLKIHTTHAYAVRPERQDGKKRECGS